MKSILFFITACVFFYSCSQQNAASTTAAKKTLDHHWLDSVIKQHSDSTYSKPYKRTDFVTAYWYINKKDTSVCQVMKDSADTVRQVIIAKKNVRIFFAQYFANGQLQATFPLDQFGQYHGATTTYFKNGNIESTGNYLHGLKTGNWKNYNEKAVLVTTDEYNNDGQVVKTTTN